MPLSSALRRKLGPICALLMRLLQEMSESSSVHSSKLVSLARSLSGLGLDAANGGPINPPDTDEPPLTRSNGIGFIRLHIPWPILSREAELQKIKVAVKKKCELRKRAGIAGIWDSIMTKVNTPFQPDVPDFDIKKDSQTNTHLKTLKHPFIRDKLHLYDIKSTETVFDNATRSRILLHEEWANYGVMHKYQPVDLIRKYFGEQIGLYFAWLGVYTQLLIPPSVLGIIVFLYGIFTVDTNVPSQETCDDNLNITMCPLCDGVCDYWHLSSVCSLARASYLFDNGATVLFAIFMSLWAACFLEHWKRRQMCLKHTWDLTSLEDEEEELRPEYEEALQEKKAKMKAQSKKKLSRAADGADGETDQMLASQIFVTFSAVFGVVVYRICMLSVWSMNPDPEAKASVRMTVTTTGIILNMLVVLVLEEVYGAIAVWLTELELPKTTEEFEERLIFKSFFLKSMNAFAPIFYVAFFKGRKLKKMYRTIQEEKGKKRAAEDEEDEAEERPKQQFDKDFTLEPFEGVSPEYMEMIIQYGFVSLFVASFPLAPAFALLNNVIEIRLDAAKFVTEIRRPDAAFVISFTSEFVPRMVYQYMYSVNGTMNGYTEHSLSYFNVSNFAPGTAPTTTLITGVSMCRYKDYRDPPWAPDAYTFSKQYWSVLAAKLAFVIFFQNLAMFLSMLVAWMIPDVPRSLREQLKKENMMLMEFLLNQDQEARAKSNSPKRSIPCFPAKIDIVVEAPQEEQEEQNVEEEEGAVEVNGDEPRTTGDSDPELEKTFEDVEENEQKQPEAEAEAEEIKDEVGEVKGGEQEKDVVVNESDGKANEEEEEGKEKEEEEQRKEEINEVEAEEKNISVDLDSLMSDLGLLDEEPTSSTSRDKELPVSGSKQELQKEKEPPSHPSSKRGSSESLRGSRADFDTRLFSLIAPPPAREPGSRAKARCSTLPSRHKGAEACYSLPRPSHSISLTRFQQAATLTPLIPLGGSLPTSSSPFPPHKHQSHLHLHIPHTPTGHPRVHTTAQSPQ
ncbi:hypothetical protein INR49_007832 [Caranx melampygus]|nr:hypothetical protein INR49_007832 [Caranx melampygus]